VIIGKTDSNGDILCDLSSPCGSEKGQQPFLLATIASAMSRIFTCRSEEGQQPFSRCGDFVWIAAKGYTTHNVRVLPIEESLASERPLPIVVQLSAAHPIRGRIVQENGGPVSNESLLLIGITNDWPLQWQTVTDRNGNFEWDDAPGGDIYVALGLGDANTTPEFLYANVAGGEVRLRVGPDWRPAGTDAKRKFLYVAFEDDIPFLPSSLELDRYRMLIATVTSSLPRPVQHFVLSTTNNWDSVRFLCIAGKDNNGEVVGELQCPIVDQRVLITNQKNSDPSQNSARLTE
jgi:hypothetical protein